jgi:hypothetical protein
MKFWSWVILFSLSFPLNADAVSLLGNQDYQRTTSDKAYILVIFCPPPEEKKPDEYPCFENTDIRKKYSQAGLYKNDGSSNPLWVVDWFFPLIDSVYISSDSNYLVTVRSPQYFLGKPHSFIGFYERGKLLKEHGIGPLIKNADELPTKGRFKNISFDDARGQLSITTNEDKNYIFDIRSGEIINQ